MQNNKIKKSISFLLKWSSWATQHLQTPQNISDCGKLPDTTNLADTTRFDTLLYNKGLHSDSVYYNVTSGAVKPDALISDAVRPDALTSDAITSDALIPDVKAADTGLLNLSSRILSDDASVDIGAIEDASGISGQDAKSASDASLAHLVPDMSDAFAQTDSKSLDHLISTAPTAPVHLSYLVSSASTGSADKNATNTDLGKDDASPRISAALKNLEGQNASGQNTSGQNTSGQNVSDLNAPNLNTSDNTARSTETLSDAVSSPLGARAQMASAEIFGSKTQPKGVNKNTKHAKIVCADGADTGSTYTDSADTDSADTDSTYTDSTYTDSTYTGSAHASRRASGDGEAPRLSKVSSRIFHHAARLLSRMASLSAVQATDPSASGTTDPSTARATNPSLARVIGRAAFDKTLRSLSRIAALFRGHKSVWQQSHRADPSGSYATDPSGSRATDPSALQTSAGVIHRADPSRSYATDPSGSYATDPSRSYAIDPSASPALIQVASSILGKICSLTTLHALLALFSNILAETKVGKGVGKRAGKLARLMVMLPVLLIAAGQNQAVAAYSSDNRIVLSPFADGGDVTKITVDGVEYYLHTFTPKVVDGAWDSGRYIFEAFNPIQMVVHYNLLRL